MKRVVMTIFVCGIASLLLLQTNAASAGECESSFQVIGDATSGLRFAATRQIPGIDMRGTVAQARAIAVEEGFLVINETSSAGEASVSFVRNGKDPDDAVPMQVFTKDNGPLVMIAVLPPGMNADPSQYKHEFCGLLGRVHADGATPAVANGTSPVDPSRTATPSSRNARPELRPRSSFDEAAARAALEPGTSNIYGKACVRHNNDNGTALFLVNGEQILLFPMTPYMAEVVPLLEKAHEGKARLALSPVAMALRMEAVTNEKGEFQFSQMKPGKYFLMARMGATLTGTRNIDRGSEIVGNTRIFYYEAQDYSNDFSDFLEKIVEIKKPGESVKVSLTPRVKLFGWNNGSTGLLGGCRNIW